MFWNSRQALPPSRHPLQRTFQPSQLFEQKSQMSTERQIYRQKSKQKAKMQQYAKEGYCRKGNAALCREEGGLRTSDVQIGRRAGGRRRS